MSHHLVEVIRLNYTYPDGTSALKNVSFRATHGEAVAVIGGNGAGKSTLLTHLNGVKSPRSGEVRIGDMPLVPGTLAQIRRTVGMVFQNPDDQLFMPTAGEDVAFGPQNLGLPAEEVEHRVSRALETVGLPGLRHKSPHRLSGGEKRLVSIAAVLSMEPDILVMDEPSSHLDPYARRRLIDLLKRFSHTRIIATHDLDLALDVCPRTLVLRKGELVADGPTGELLRDEALLDSCRLERPWRLRD